MLDTNSNGHGNGSGADLVTLLVEGSVGRPVNTLSLAKAATTLRREANALVDLAADLERAANEVEVFAAHDQVRRFRAADRSRRYRAKKRVKEEIRARLSPVPFR